MKQKICPRILICLFKKSLLTKIWHDLLYKSPRTQTENTDNSTRIITCFSNQHLIIKKIVKKYWHILTLDPQASPFVPGFPGFTFRRTKSLEDKLVSSEFKSDKKDPCKLVGTFPCGGCNHCRYMNINRHLTLLNGEFFKPRHCANCKTKGIVYLLLCDCSCFYVGKKKMELWQRAYRYVLSLRTCNPELPLGRRVFHSWGFFFPKISFCCPGSGSPRTSARWLE